MWERNHFRRIVDGFIRHQCGKRRKSRFYNKGSLTQMYFKLFKKRLLKIMISFLKFIEKYCPNPEKAIEIDLKMAAAGIQQTAADIMEGMRHLHYVLSTRGYYLADGQAYIQRQFSFE